MLKWQASPFNLPSKYLEAGMRRGNRALGSGFINHEFMYSVIKGTTLGSGQLTGLTISMIPVGEN